MYILAKQRDTIARTLEPTKERDSRNVSGPLTDRRPSCRDLYSRTCGLRLVAGLLKLLLATARRIRKPGAAIFALRPAM